MEDPENEFLVSVVTAYEAKWKFTLGKLELASPLLEGFQTAIDRLEMRAVEITLAHAEFAASFEPVHRDPFDRLIAAQALLEGTELVTRDPAFAHFGVRTVW